MDLRERKVINLLKTVLGSGGRFSHRCRIFLLTIRGLGTRRRCSWCRRSSGLSSPLFRVRACQEKSPEQYYNTITINNQT